MGNTEMTKYMAAGAFQDLSADKASIPNSGTWLAGLAASGRYGGKLYGVPYYAGSRVVTYRTDLFKKAGLKVPTSLGAVHGGGARSSAATNTDKGFSPVYIAGTDWYFAMSFVYDFGGSIATQVSGKWKGTLVLAALDGRADGVQELLHRGLARQQDDRRDPPEPVRRVRPGQGRLDGRAGLVQLLRRRHEQGR